MTNDQAYRDVVEFARNYLMESEHFSDGTLKDDEPLFSTGTISSIALVELVLRLEERFGISISTRDVSLENFDSIEMIAKYAAARLKEAGG